MFSRKRCFYSIIVISFLATSLPFYYLWAEEKASAQAQPQITFDSTKYDAGEVWEGDKVSHTFIVKNTGVVQLDIAKVKPG